MNGQSSVRQRNQTDIRPLSTQLKQASAGLNLCHENADELFTLKPDLDFIQIHPEHLIQEQGGKYRDQLDILRYHYKVVLHGFGLSIGSCGPLDHDYLRLVRDLLKEHPEAVFSDHFSWSSLSHHHFHDLIPLIQNNEKVQKQAKSASCLPRSNDGQMPEVEADSADVEFHRGTSGALLQLARS